MEEFAENFYSFEYIGNLHLNDDKNDSHDEEDNYYQVIPLEMEDVE